MPVTSSTFQLDARPQVDGRRFCRETHVLAYGDPIVVEYLSAVGADNQAIMDARVPRVDAQLADAEIQNIINGVVSGASPREMSRAQMAERLRTLLQTTSGVEQCQIATRILGMIEGGEMTDAEFRAALGVNTPTYNNIKTQMETLRSHWLAVQAGASF